MKYDIGDLVVDEDGCHGAVVIKYNDGDVCWIENDAAHPNPKVVGHWAGQSLDCTGIDPVKDDTGKINIR